MNLGIQIEPQFGYTFEKIVEIVECAVRNGFSKVWFSDHFMLDGDSTGRVLLDPWLVMASLVRTVPSIHVGSLVFCNSYRNPALHAKMAATLDVLSGGRFDFGFGAGWKEIEYRAYGYRFPPDHERIDQLVEAIHIIRGAWTQELFTFHGEHYKVENLISFPKPRQTPHPPIIVGTMHGRPRMVEVAARYGDGINLAWAFDIQSVKSIFNRIDDILEEEGKSSSRFRKTLGYWAQVFASEEELERAIVTRSRKQGLPVEEVRKQVSSALWGTPDSIKQRLTECVEIGVTDVILMLPYGQECQQLEGLAPMLTSSGYSSTSENHLH